LMDRRKGRPVGRGICPEALACSTASGKRSAPGTTAPAPRQPMSLGSSASYFFYDKRHPNEMGEAEISTFVSHLATRRKVSPSTQGQALAALLFLYKNVLRRELNLMEIARAKRPARLPLILSRTEVAAILAHLQGTCWLMASLMYGSGLRVLECCRLRVKDIDFERRELTPGATPGTPTVRQAQGGTARREVGRSKRRSVIERIEPATWLNAKVESDHDLGETRARVRQVFRCERIWRTFADGKAKDGFGRCTQRRRDEMDQGRLEPGPTRSQKGCRCVSQRL